MIVYSVVVVTTYPEIKQIKAFDKVVDEFSTGKFLYRNQRFLVVAESPYNAIQKVLKSKEITSLKNEEVYDCQVVDKQEVTASLI